MEAPGTRTHKNITSFYIWMCHSWQNYFPQSRFQHIFPPDFCCEYWIRQLSGAFCAGDTRCSSPDRGEERERGEMCCRVNVSWQLWVCVFLSLTSHCTQMVVSWRQRAAACETCGRKPFTAATRLHEHQRICAFLKSTSLTVLKKFQMLELHRCFSGLMSATRLRICSIAVHAHISPLQQICHHFRCKLSNITVNHHETTHLSPQTVVVFNLRVALKSYSQATSCFNMPPHMLLKQSGTQTDTQFLSISTSRAAQ